MKLPLATLSLTALSLFIFSDLFSQCGNTGNSLQNYTILTSQESVSSSIIDEISGITYNDETEELYVVSDDGKLARRRTSGVWQDIDVNNWSGNTCREDKFGDIEGITYMGKVSNNIYRYAIAEERERYITFVNISTTQTSINFPNNAYLKFSGLSYTEPNCGANDGIEGLAYDSDTNKMFFCKERNNQRIYSFTVPSTINGQTINPTQIVDLANISNLNSYAIHGLDMFTNGNIMALVAKQGPSNMDPGLYDRMALEFDTCGNLISKVDLEPTISNSAELEGIVSVDNSICVIGEFGVLYHLDTPPIASVFPDLLINQLGTHSQTGSMITQYNVRIGNIGTDHATSYDVGAYLSTDLNIDFSDTRIGTATSISSHLINEAKYFTYSFDTDALNLSPGTYYLGFIADEFDSQTESDETNNRVIFTSRTIVIESCASTMEVDYAPVPSGVYETSVSIESDGYIASSSTVEYSAGDFIDLQPGFEVTTNANFLAHIEGCQ